MERQTTWREELAWAAGFFDGEGYVGGGAKGRMRASVAQTNRIPLDRFYDAILGLGTVSGPTIPSNPNHKPVWKFDSKSAYNTQAIIAMLWPFLSRPKKDQYKRELAGSHGITFKSKYRKSCPKGHKYDEANTIIEYTERCTRRRCRACRKAYARIYNKTHWQKYGEKRKEKRREQKRASTASNVGQ